MYLCDVSKALHTKIVDLIASKLIINALKSCSSIMNTPFQIYADPGSPFVGVKNKRQRKINQLVNDIQSYWPSINLVIHPTEAPIRNGYVETLVILPKFS